MDKNPQQKIRLKCEAILFDLDGVLIDSTSCITRHWEAWARRHGLDIHAILRVAHGMRTIETIRAVAPRLDAEQETLRFNAIEVADTEGVVAIEGAREVLGALPEGAWAIVTSGSRDLAQARLARVNLPLPRALVCGDDVREGKPAPEPYLTGARRLGVAPDACLVIEDAPAGVAAGKRAGMRVIGIAATYPRETLMEKGADVVVERLRDVQVSRGQAGVIVDCYCDE